MAAAFTSTPGYAATIIHVPGDAATLDQAVSMVPDGGIVELAAGTYSGGFAYNNLGKAFTIRALVAESVAHFLRCVWQGNVAKNEAGGLRVSTDSIAVVHSSQFNNNSVSLPSHRNTAGGGRAIQ